MWRELWQSPYFRGILAVVVVLAFLASFNITPGSKEAWSGWLGALVGALIGALIAYVIAIETTLRVIKEDRAARQEELDREAKKRAEESARLAEEESLKHGLRYREAFVQMLAAAGNMADCAQFPELYKALSGTPNAEQIFEAVTRDQRSIIQFASELYSAVSTIRLMEKIDYPFDSRSQILRLAFKGYLEDAIDKSYNEIREKSTELSSWIAENNMPFHGRYSVLPFTSISPKSIVEYKKDIAKQIPATDLDLIVTTAWEDYRNAMNQDR